MSTDWARTVGRLGRERDQTATYRPPEEVLSRDSNLEAERLELSFTWFWRPFAALGSARFRENIVSIGIA